MIKVGDKVRYTGKPGRDLTSGKVYDVHRVFYGGSVFVNDDAWAEIILTRDDCELITEGPAEYDYAAQAANHGIKITFAVGDVYVVFDGSK